MTKGKRFFVNRSVNCERVNFLLRLRVSVPCTLFKVRIGFVFVQLNADDTFSETIPVFFTLTMLFVLFSLPFIVEEFSIKY